MWQVPLPYCIGCQCLPSDCPPWSFPVLSPNHSAFLSSLHCRCPTVSVWLLSLCWFPETVCLQMSKWSWWRHFQTAYTDSWCHRIPLPDNFPNTKRSEESGASSSRLSISLALSYDSPYCRCAYNSSSPYCCSTIPNRSLPCVPKTCWRKSLLPPTLLHCSASRLHLPVRYNSLLPRLPLRKL